MVPNATTAPRGGLHRAARIRLGGGEPQGGIRGKSWRDRDDARVIQRHQLALPMRVGFGHDLLEIAAHSRQRQARGLRHFGGGLAVQHLTGNQAFRPGQGMRLEEMQPQGAMVGLAGIKQHQRHASPPGWRSGVTATRLT